VRRPGRGPARGEPNYERIASVRTP